MSQYPINPDLVAPGALSDNERLKAERVIICAAPLPTILKMKLPAALTAITLC